LCPNPPIWAQIGRYFRVRAGSPNTHKPCTGAKNRHFRPRYDSICKQEVGGSIPPGSTTKSLQIDRFQYPLNALLGAFVRAQDENEPPLPVMLVVSGLPPLVQNLQAVRSHSERLFRVEELGNLSLTPAHRGEPSPAALALISIFE